MAPFFPPVTTREAALLAGVQPDTIRQWRHRNHIAPIGGTARHPLYEAAQVLKTCGARGCTKTLCVAAAAGGDPRRNVVDALLTAAA